MSTNKTNCKEWICETKIIPFLTIARNFIILQIFTTASRFIITSVSLCFQYVSPERNSFCLSFHSWFLYKTRQDTHKRTPANQTILRRSETNEQEAIRRTETVECHRQCPLTNYTGKKFTFVSC